MPTTMQAIPITAGSATRSPSTTTGQHGDQHGADAPGDGVDQPQVAPGVRPPQHDEVEGLQRRRDKDEPVSRRCYGVEQQQGNAQGQQHHAGADEQRPCKDLRVSGALQQQVPRGMAERGQQDQPQRQCGHGAIVPGGSACGRDRFPRNLSPRYAVALRETPTHGVKRERRHDGPCAEGGAERGAGAGDRRRARLLPGRDPTSRSGWTTPRPTRPPSTRPTPTPESTTQCWPMSRSTTKPATCWATSPSQTRTTWWTSCARSSPPDYLREQTEANIDRFTAFLRHERDDLAVYVELQAPLARIEPAVLGKVDQYIVDEIEIEAPQSPGCSPSTLQRMAIAYAERYTQLSGGHASPVRAVAEHAAPASAGGQSSTAGSTWSGPSPR